MNGFPLSAEQVVRLVAAVLTELNPPKGTKLDRREDAVLLRLVDSVGVPLETFEHAQCPVRSLDQPRPRDTRGLGVMPFRAPDDAHEADGVRECGCGERLQRAFAERIAVLKIMIPGWEEWSVRPKVENGVDDVLC